MAATLSAAALAVAAAEQWRTDGVRDTTLYAAMLPSGDAERHGVYAGLQVLAFNGLKEHFKGVGRVLDAQLLPSIRFHLFLLQVSFKHILNDYMILQARLTGLPTWARPTGLPDHSD